MRKPAPFTEQTQAEGIFVTRGKDGITLVTRNKVQDFPVKPVEIVDVTGVGDTVIATLALAVASGLSVEEAAQAGQPSCSLVVARFGAASVTLMKSQFPQKLAPGKKNYF